MLGSSLFVPYSPRKPHPKPPPKEASEAAKQQKSILRKLDFSILAELDTWPSPSTVEDEHYRAEKGVKPKFLATLEKKLEPYSHKDTLPTEESLQVHREVLEQIATKFKLYEGILNQIADHYDAYIIANVGYATKVSHMQKQHELLHEEFDRRLREASNKHKQQCTGLTNEISSLQKEINRLDQHGVAANQEVQQLKRQIEQLKEENNHLIEQASQKDKEIARLQRDANAILEEWQKSKVEDVRKINHLGNVSTENQSLTNELKKVKEAMLSEREKYINTCKTLSETVSDINLKYHNTTTDLKRIRGQLEKATKMNSEYENELSLLRGQVEQFESERARLTPRPDIDREFGKVPEFRWTPGFKTNQVLREVVKFIDKLYTQIYTVKLRCHKVEKVIMPYCTEHDFDSIVFPEASFFLPMKQTMDGVAVPGYLKAIGTVRNRGLLKTEVANMCFDMLRSLRRFDCTDGTYPAGNMVPLADFLPSYFAVNYGTESSQLEIAYNFIYGLQRFTTEPIIKLTWKMLVGEIGTWVVEDQNYLIYELQTALTGQDTAPSPRNDKGRSLDRLKKSGSEKPAVSKMHVFNLVEDILMRARFTPIQILGAKYYVHCDNSGHYVNTKALFERDKLGSESRFLKWVRNVHLENLLADQRDREMLCLNLSECDVAGMECIKPTGCKNALRTWESSMSVEEVNTVTLNIIMCMAVDAETNFIRMPMSSLLKQFPIPEVIFKSSVERGEDVDDQYPMNEPKERPPAEPDTPALGFSAIAQIHRLSRRMKSKQSTVESIADSLPKTPLTPSNKAQPSAPPPKTPISTNNSPKTVDSKPSFTSKLASATSGRRSSLVKIGDRGKRRKSDALPVTSVEGRPHLFMTEKALSQHAFAESVVFRNAQMPTANFLLAARRVPLKRHFRRVEDQSIPL